MPDLRELNDDNDGLPHITVQSEQEMADFLWDRLKQTHQHLTGEELQKHQQIISLNVRLHGPAALHPNLVEKATVLTQYKPSTQVTLRSHIRKHLNRYFESKQLRDIGPEEVQCFVSSVKVSSSKTKKNLFVTFQMVWKTARAWGYVAHDATSGVVLPKRNRVARRFFSLVAVQRILAAAAEPLVTFLWLAAETGMRAGELGGLRIGDIDFDRSVVCVRQSAWRGKIQSPKSKNAFRSFALSTGLLAHLAAYCSASRPNERGLLFATRNGTPWDANLLVKRKLYPLLDSLGIERGGLHAFRHTNSTLMDRLGVPLKVRQHRLGHSDSSLTLDVYTHVASEDDVRFAEQMGGILRPFVIN